MHAALRSAFIVLLLPAFIAACSNQPGAGDARRDAEQVATNDLPSKTAFKVTDLKRENGWPEGTDYKVHFTYNLTSTVDYPQMVIQLLQESTTELKAMPAADRAAFGMQVGLSSMMAGLSSEVPDVKAELEAYSQDPTISAYLRNSRDFQNDRTLLAQAVFVTTATTMDYGIRKGQQAGTKLPRQVTLTYRKTEKGWQKLG